MPFINGRYYANPAYGEGLERARKNEASNEFNDGIARPGDTYSVEPMPGRVSYDDADDGTIELLAEGQQQAPKHPAHRRSHAAKPESPEQVANSTYNETSGLRPITKRGQGSVDDLSDARDHIARVVRSGKASVASGSLSSAAEQAVKSYPPARAAYKDSLRAARKAFVGPDPTGGATHFYLDYGQKRPRWAVGQKPAATFGPFKNAAGGGDIPRDAMVKVVIIR